MVSMGHHMQNWSPYMTKYVSPMEQKQQLTALILGWVDWPEPKIKQTALIFSEGSNNEIDLIKLLSTFSLTM